MEKPSKPKQTPSEKIAALQARIEQIKRAAEAREARESFNSRSSNRKKFLIGAMHLHAMLSDKSIHRREMAYLNEYLKRDVDRAVFGFPPLADAAAPVAPVAPPLAAK
jgi:hypothetical protein